MPRCKCCNDKFESKYFNQKYCMINDECIRSHIQYVKDQKKKQLRKRKKELKEQWNLKKRKDYYQEALRDFNEYIRERDRDKPCISCDAAPGTYRITSGHFYPQGTYRNIALDEDNSHGQCWYNCNKNKHGNLSEYRPRLIKRIGLKRVESLDKRRLETKKHTIPELIELKTFFKNKTKQIKQKGL